MFVSFSLSICLFLCLSCAVSFFCPALRFTVMECLRSDKQHRHNRPPPKTKWITLNTEPEKDFIVASTAPDMMAFVLPGHHGFKLSSSSSVHNLLFFILLSSLTLERSPCSLVIFITSFYPLTVVVSRSGQIRGNRRAG